MALEDLLSLGAELTYFFKIDGVEFVLNNTPHTVSLFVQKLKDLENKFKLIASSVKPELLNSHTSTDIDGNDVSSIKNTFQHLTSLIDKQKKYRQRPN